MQLTFDMLNRRWPHAGHSFVEGVAASAADVFKKFGIETATEQADFLAQVSSETGGGASVEENLNYSSSRLCQVWPSKFPTLASAVPYAHSPRALADRVYGGRGGNALGTDDGWNFRGRGGIQITFKDNYRAVGDAFGAGLDLVHAPHLASSPVFFLAVAAAYWKMHDLNKWADGANFRQETLAINGGLNGFPDRERWRSIWRSELCAQ